MLSIFGAIFGRPQTGRDSVWKSVNELEPIVRVARARKGQLALRAAAPIVAIDDQAFEPGQNLLNNGYKITHLRDINNVHDVETFPIVLCDLQGVGAQLHADMQGAHLIREIKTHFPAKVVVAYTGIAKNRIMTKQAQSYADTFLKKDADLDEWITALDEAVIRVTDPVIMWKEFRKRMLDAGMTPFQLTQLEHAYVSGFERSGDHARAAVESTAGRLNLSQDIRAIVQGFIASLVFKAHIG